MSKSNPVEIQRPSPKSLRITLAVIFLSMLGSVVFGWLRWKRFDEEWKSSALASQAAACISNRGWS